MWTPWKNSRVVVVASGLLLLGLALASDLSSTASAAPKRPPEPQSASNAQLAEGLAVLHATKVTLQQANHDYGGHRAKAVKAIDAAHHQLKLALEFQTKKKIHVGGDAAKLGPGKEAQAQSDMQLGVSIATLKKTVAVLEGADHDYGGHRLMAVKDLHGAIKELETALKFEKRKEGK
jgi:hypothetical protein